MTARPSRRLFLEKSFMAAAAAIAGTAELHADDVDRGSKNMLPIIDTHQHLWDTKKLRLAWLKSAPTLNRDFLMSDYLKATEGLNVVKSVYMEVDVDPAQQVEEAESVIEICERAEDADGRRGHLRDARPSRRIQGVSRPIQGQPPRQRAPPGPAQRRDPTELLS